MVRRNQLYEKPGKYYRNSEHKGPMLEAVDPCDYSGAREGRDCHEAKEQGRDRIRYSYLL